MNYLWKPGTGNEYEVYLDENTCEITIKSIRCIKRQAILGRVGEQLKLTRSIRNETLFPLYDPNDILKEML